MAKMTVYKKDGQGWTQTYEFTRPEMVYSELARALYWKHVRKLYTIRRITYETDEAGNQVITVYKKCDTDEQKVVYEVPHL